MKRYHHNGHLTIETGFETGFTGIRDIVFAPLSVSLSCKYSGMEQIWSLGIRIKDINDTGPVCLPKGGKLLIKLYDGEIIELKQLLEGKDTMYDQRVKNNGDILYYVQGQYLITEDKIQKIASCQVTKVRVELVNYEERNEYYKDYTDIKISEAVKKEYDEVLKAVQMGDNYIYQDF